MSSAQNTSKRSGQVKFKPESISIRISPHILKLSPGEVARYAGGSQYKMDRKMEALTATLLKSTERLVNPAFVYAIYPIKGVDSERGASLQNGIFVKLPPEEQDPDIVHLITSVCTLGPDLEVKVSQLMSQGNALQATLMDAAGVALLESLTQKGPFRSMGTVYAGPPPVCLGRHHGAYSAAIAGAATPSRISECC